MISQCFWSPTLGDIIPIVKSTKHHVNELPRFWFIFPNFLNQTGQWTIPRSIWRLRKSCRDGGIFQQMIFDYRVFFRGTSWNNLHSHQPSCSQLLSRHFGRVAAPQLASRGGRFRQGCARRSPAGWCFGEVWAPPGLVNIQKTMENHHFQWVNPL